jgi:hypothetical protein
MGNGGGGADTCFGLGFGCAFGFGGGGVGANVNVAAALDTVRTLGGGVLFMINVAPTVPIKPAREKIQGIKYRMLSSQRCVFFVGNNTDILCTSHATLIDDIDQPLC